MKKIIVRALAVVGFLTVASVALLISLGILAAKDRQNAPESMALVIDFDTTIAEHEKTSAFDLALDEEASSLTDILRAIDRAKSDPRVKALVGRFGSSQPSLAHAQEIRASIKAFRDAKKPTYAFGTSYGQFGGAGKAYFLASAFETLWLQPIGAVSLNGPAIQSPFFKEALDKLGAKADFLQREDYKSFMDMAMRNEFAPQVRSNLESLLGDLSNQMANGLSESRGWDFEKARKAMAHGPYTDQEAIKDGIVSRLGYEDELEKELKDAFSSDLKFVEPGTYLGYGRGDSRGKDHKESRTSIALVQGSGMIVARASDGESLTGDAVLGADTIVAAFDTIIEDKDIKAVLFRIDSPGGSPEASEMIRRAVIRAQAAGKPVIVSMGSVAASGGYWAAMNADRIIANPGTLTGSIGVITGKFAIGPALEKYGIRIGTVVASGIAPSYETMWSMGSEFTPAQRERVTAMIDRTYQAFLTNVAEARHIPLDKTRALAGGRVYTGAQAQKLGLVDTVGGYKTALAAVREKLNLAPDAPLKFVMLPESHSNFEKLIKLLFSYSGAHAGAALPMIDAGRLGSPLAALWNEGLRLTRADHAVEARLQFVESLAQ